VYYLYLVGPYVACKYIYFVAQYNLLRLSKAFDYCVGVVSVDFSVVVLLNALLVWYL